MSDRLPTYAKMNFALDMPIVPSYAAELSESDSDLDGDVDASDENMGISSVMPITTIDSPRNDASGSRLPPANRLCSDVHSIAHSPTISISASTLPIPLVVSANESEDRSDSNSDDSDDEQTPDGNVNDMNRSQAAPVPKMSTIERCIKRYVSIVESRRNDRRLKLTWQQIVDEARRAIQYEIDNKPAVWKEGIGRAPSYLAMMKALLNVSGVRSVNRKMMLEVIEQAAEVLEERLGGE